MSGRHALTHHEEGLARRQPERFGGIQMARAFLPFGGSGKVGTRMLDQNRCTEIPSLLRITGRRGDIMAPEPYIITVMQSMTWATMRAAHLL